MGDRSVHLDDDGPELRPVLPAIRPDGAALYVHRCGNAEWWHQPPGRVSAASCDACAPGPDGGWELLYRRAPSDPPTDVSSVIAVSNRFARAANGEPRYARAAGHPAGGDWVRLRTGSGRQYEGYRSPDCPGDGVTGHQHDIRCVEQPES